MSVSFIFYETFSKQLKLLNKELPWVPLYASDIVKAYNKNLKNYTPNTFAGFYNVEKWEFGK